MKVGHNMKLSIRNTVRLTLAIIAAWIFFLSDYLLDMREMFSPLYYQPFENMPASIAIYACLAMLATPFLAMGIAIILRLSKLTIIVPFMYFSLLTINVFMHSSFIFYYYTVKNLGINSSSERLFKDFDSMKNIFGASYFITVAIISLLLFIVIITKRSVFPRYFAFFNPLVGVVLLKLISFVSVNLAEAIHLILIPASTLAIFMTISIIYIFRHPELMNLEQESKDRFLY